MATLIRPQGKLTYRDPAKDGVVTVLGLSRDWRPTDNWELRGAELIGPLNCISPMGDFRPTNMVWGAGNWGIDNTYNQAVRDVTFSGSPAFGGAEFYDGSVYAAGTPLTTCLAHLITDPAVHTPTYLWQPNVVMQIISHTPPPGQGAIPQVSLGVACKLKVGGTTPNFYLDDADGTWMDGRANLVIPLGSELYKNPVFHAVVGIGGGDVFTTGWIFGVSSDCRSADQGPSREAWVLEYLEDTARYPGGHILIRNSNNWQSWWHIYHPALRLQAGFMSLGLAGCQIGVNVSKVLYSDSLSTDSTCWPRDYRLIPGAAWEPAVTYGVVKSQARWFSSTGWAVTAAGGAAPGYRPVVTFSPGEGSTEDRPVLWLATEDHAPTIAVPPGLPADDTTEGDGLLREITLTMDSTWKRTQATAEFYGAKDGGEIYPGWKERGQVVVNMGWDAAAGAGFAAADLATLYIMPGGIERWRDGAEGQGTPRLRVQLGDFIAARMANTCLLDFRQAAGQTATAWFHAFGHRLGLPDSLIDVQADMAGIEITLNEIPGLPALEAQDGEDPAAHADAVCAVMGWRWGWDEKLFLDAGRQTYQPGVSTISFALNYDTLTSEDVVRRIERTREGARWRNCYKGMYGHGDQRQATYHVPDETARAAVGGDYWAFLDEPDAVTSAAVLKRFNELHSKWLEALLWDGPMRTGLTPDMFVNIADLPNLGLVTGAVYQIVEHTLRGDSHVNEATSHIKAVLVYLPGTRLAGPMGGAGMGSRGLGG